jgi:hypothetical protein
MRLHDVVNHGVEGLAERAFTVIKGDDFDARGAVSD